MNDLPGPRLPRLDEDIRGYGLRLRQWRPGDESVLVRGLNDPEFKRWNTPKLAVTTEADAAAFIRDRMTSWELGNRAQFCVTEDAPDGRVLGSVGVGEIDLWTRQGRVGYWVLPEARGRGIARRALELCTAWCFEQAGLHRIELGHAADHRTSCRIAEESGYLPEGRLREAMFAEGRKGAFRDVHLHAVLADDPRPPVRI